MVVSRKLQQENFINDNTDERKNVGETEAIEKTDKSRDKSTKEVESLPQIIGGVRRKLDELDDSHPERIFIEVGMFQADIFFQHLLTKEPLILW